MRPAEFTTPEQTKLWPFEGRALHHQTCERKMTPSQSHTTQLGFSWSQILSQAQSQLDGATESQEGGASVSPMRGRCLSGLGEGDGPCPRATQLPLSQILPRAWQGGATRSPESGASKSPISKRHQSGSQERGGMAPSSKPHYSVTDTPSLPRPLHPSPGG